MLAFAFSAVSLTLAQATPAPRRPLVEIRTTRGTMIVALYNETPKHRDNFLRLVREGRYDSLLFHRVIPSFMVQGGDPESRRAPSGTELGQGGPGYGLPAEIRPGLIHKRGALAAARQPNNANSDSSSGSQFFLVLGNRYLGEELDRVAERNAHMGTPVTYTAEQRKEYALVGGAPHLDGAYTVFGQVVEGLDVIDAIALAPCDARDRPLVDIRAFMRILE
ncbi:MAG: peptidylprolyl isomerase [Flavobacteriales bacterium]|nr:peptidylprolyl isomerase [Flavobacteriales bacterium]